MKWRALLATCCAVTNAPAAAQTVPMQALAETIRTAPAPVTSVPQPLDSVVQTPLLAHWAPRRWLAERGIALTGHFIAESAVNDRGYRSDGWDYIQHLDFGAQINLSKLGVGDGTVRILFSDRLGHPLQAERTGAYIQNQAYYGQGNNFRIDELSYERLLLDRRLSLKGGFYSMGNDFAGLPYVCNFNNNGHCGHPLGLLYGSGWVDSPTGQWGARAKWSDRAGWYVAAGVYDVTPLRKTQEHGLDLGFPRTTGVIVPIEVGLVRGKTPADYPGTYKLGIYHDTSKVAALGEAGRQVRGRNGMYVEAAQQIWKPRRGRVQGLSLFGVVTVNDRQTGLFRTTYEAGASWRGLLPGRGDDIASLGWVRLDVNSRVRDQQRALGQAEQTNEQMIELNYGIQLDHSFLLRPGLQYVIHPGAYASRPDSLVFTVHFQATL
ncbi:carbohydrate porin [Novosphingobium sp.]|uniref:carbohydrate porin n=1 Tax=Novosphingobium sp. TaxID=1874826 RepID=UPI003BA9ECA4